MIPDDARDRLRRALDGADRYEALPALARRLRDEGMEQWDLYRLFAEFQAILDPEGLEYDALVETMDLIWGGPWAKGEALYDHELTDEEVEEGGGAGD